MGGPGSTRWRDHEKATTVEQCLAIDLGTLKRQGALKGAPHVVRWRDLYSGEVLGYAGIRRTLPIEGDALLVGFELPNKKDIIQRIELTSTLPHFGGERWWFKCDCGHRGYRLYLPPGTERFACTDCHDLVYQSAQQHNPRVDLYLGNPESLKHAILDYPYTPDSRCAAKALSIMLRFRAPEFFGAPLRAQYPLAELCDDEDFAGILNASAS